jgi:hypothetical protein
MTELFRRGDLGDYLEGRLTAARRDLDGLREDDVLSRSIEDLVAELVDSTRVEPLEISDEPIDGDVAEATIAVRDQFTGVGHRPAFRVRAVYGFTGDRQLLHYRPSTSVAFTSMDAEIGDGTLTVVTTLSAAPGTTDEAARRAFVGEMDKIKRNAKYGATDVAAFNDRLEHRLRSAVTSRKTLLQARRDLAGALGFPLSKRTDAPAPVPMKRKIIGTSRTSTSPSERKPYQDEPALTQAQYEDAINVVGSTLLAMERTPSVASGKPEEELRDQILVQLNGTFEGNATGETFIQSGKTDILLRVDDRHVFVAECKWWSGAKALGDAIDQLLSYLPWRDEKAALVIFIDRKDASSAFDKAEQAVRHHAAYKRAGVASADLTKRRDFVLGHPGDLAREIQLALLFAVLPREAKG